MCCIELKKGTHFCLLWDTRSVTCPCSAFYPPGLEKVASLEVKETSASRSKSTGIVNQGAWQVCTSTANISLSWKHLLVSMLHLAAKNEVYSPC